MEALFHKIRDPIRALMERLAVGLDRASGGKLSPDGVTLVGLGMHLPIALLIAARHNYWAAGLLVVFGLLDSVDGALARLQNSTTPRGMFLDSVTDRMKEIMLYTGAAYAIIANTGRPYLAVWVVAACGCSLLTSYVNAWGEAVMSRHHADKHAMNKTFRGGLLPFEARMFVLLVGLLSNRITLAIIVIALGAGYTAISRLVRVFSKLQDDNVQA